MKIKQRAKYTLFYSTLSMKYSRNAAPDNLSSNCKIETKTSQFDVVNAPAKALG